MISSLPSFKRLALSLTLALIAVVALTAWMGRVRAQGGPPQVTDSGPAANSVSVDPSAVVTVAFSHPMSPTTISSRTFRVHGSMSGLLSGVLSYDGAARTATFDPAQALKPGEWVVAGVTTGTRDVTGTALALPYAWSFVAQASHGSARFVPASPPHYDVGSQPCSVYAADLDGDSDIDLITASAWDDTVSILMNKGAGVFTPTSPRDYAVDDYPFTVRGLDLDGDGDVDLVTANGHLDTVSVLLNAGDGTFSPATPRDYAVGEYPRALCGADLDGDGDVDVATANFFDDTISVLKNEGNGTFAAATPRDYGVGNGPAGVSCIDLDSDGDVDLAVANEYDDDVSLLLNDGSATFTPADPRDYAVGNAPRAILGVDLDRDSDVDLVTANYGGNDVSVLLNDGMGHFSSTVDDGAVHTGPYWIQSADLDGDGDVDLVTANTGSGDVSVLLNAGDGTFEPATPRDHAAGDASYAVDTADLDGDEDLDLVVADYSNDRMSILLNFGLEIQKTAVTPVGWPGLPVTYTTSYTNHDAGTVSGVVLTDHLPLSLTNSSYTYTGPLITPTAGLTYAWQVAPLPPGAMGVMTIGAIVSPALNTDASFDNVATVADRSGQRAAVAALFVDATPKLWVDKSVRPLPHVAPGEPITYTIQVTVSGHLTMPGSLTDDLPPGTHFVTATPGFTPITSVAWALPTGTFRPPTTFQFTMVLTADGPPRPLSNLAQAMYPGVLTATDQAGTWIWQEVPTDTCQRDVVLAFDRSGSMQEDTRCYGCWESTGEYPEGDTFPLPFTIVPTTGVAVHCQAAQPITYQGYTYLSVEAEHYSRYLIEADYHRDRTEFPKIWWAMQRQYNSNASSPDTRSAFMRVGPHSEAALHYPAIGDIQYPPAFSTTPRLDYDITVPVSGTYYVWMRAQGGQRWGGNPLYSHRSVHVGLGGSPMATGTSPTQGGYNVGAVGYNWRWTRVLPLNLTAGISYTLNFWAAGPGFRLDKIVLTTDPRTDLVEYGHPLDWDVPGVWDAGPAETHGRTGWACHPDDPRFAPADPGTGELDELYDDRQPVRLAIEASKSFVRRFNPALDQIGFVSYSTNSSVQQELFCQVYPGYCEDFESVADQIETVGAFGSTNIADALWDGLWVLMTGQEPELDPEGEGLPPKAPGTQHYGRAQTHGTLVLITDGQANYVPILPNGYGNCYSDDLWPDQPDESEGQRRARECVAWFALRARERGVAIYTIGLGEQADHTLLAHVAEVTGGSYYSAPNAQDLEQALNIVEDETISACLSSSVYLPVVIKPNEFDG